MSPSRLLLLCCSLLMLAFAGCGPGRELAYAQVEIDALEEQNADLKAELARKDAELQALRSQPTPRSDEHIRDALTGTGAEFEWRNGELVISVTNDILFSPGSATLTGQAKTTMGRISALINGKYAANYLRVEGHTDSQPIRRTRDKWEDNWHLAGARARSVLHELIERNGVSRERIAFAGYADTRPRASNSSKAGQSRNRRVEIVVLPTSPPGR